MVKKVIECNRGIYKREVHEPNISFCWLQGDIEIRAPGPGTYPRASAGMTAYDSCVLRRVCS